MNKPAALHKGDRVAVVAPAGQPVKGHLMQGVRVLEEMGLEVMIGRHVFDVEEDPGKMDRKRVTDLHEAFFDPSIMGILCANGGFGSARIAPLLDYERIAENPKIFWGYSDITYLLNALQKWSGLVTFHGPMVASDLNEEQRTAETVSSFSHYLMGNLRSMIPAILLSASFLMVQERGIWWAET
ncbi:S66 peptidase family protein [Rossellomorea sp. H39__3]